MTEAMTDGDVGLIVLLLPLAAAMVVFQDNPYNALVVRGILGAIAALVYGVLGAADVALTEALMGTMLAIALYAVAVRSSLVLRLGVLATEVAEPSPGLMALCEELRRGVADHHLRLELVPYDDRAALAQALVERDVHGICTRSHGTTAPYDLVLRVARLYGILQEAVQAPTACLSYVAEPMADGMTATTAEPMAASITDSNGGLMPQEPHR